MVEPEVTLSDELQAFVDGEMERDQAVAFAAKVAASPALARQVARLRGDKAALQKTYSAIADQPIPDRLRAPLRRHRRQRRLVQVAGGMAVAAALALVFWLVPPGFGQDRLVAEALSARQGGRADARMVSATDLELSERRDRLLAETLKIPIRVPDLSAADYHLSAIALYHQAAQVSYRDSHDRLFTLYLRSPLGPDRFDMTARGAIEICVWENSEMAVAMVGEIDAKAMLKLAAATYADLNL